MKPADFFLYHGLRALSGLARLMPASVARSCGNLIGQVSMVCCRRRSQLCRRNMQRAGFDPDMCRESFRHMGRMLVLFLRLRGSSPEQLLKRVNIVGFENYEKVRARTDRIILVTAHLGNWERLGWIHSHLSGQSLKVVARPADQPGVDRFLEEVRQQGGFSILEKHRGVRAMIRALQQGNELGLLIDQKVKPEMGVMVPFFGEMIPALPVVSLLARATGAAIVPVFIGEEEDGRETIHYLPEVKPTSDDVAETALLNQLIEEYIRRYPEQWFWVHNRWRYAAPVDQPADDVVPQVQKKSTSQ